MLQDPLNDAMATIRNAETAGKRECVLRPASKLIGRVLKVMQEADYVTAFEFIEDGRGGMYRVTLKGNINSCGVIKPRFAVRRQDLEKYEARYLPAQDFGVLILTTTEGVISQLRAKEMGVGGKLLAFVY
ncbi:MAG: 30S ribosomal protein S8 [Euryarchaeota archaeon RBG_19FT_COMBO_69_17]|uniref:Small ribosomal subunit protein uS8 n=2 Tax=environmental samples TaxID=68359 RepID=A0A0H4T224_9EURY|nr:30S ribosomal protein S8P [uncultured archaeon]AJS13298.1 30S ribosomal protein S8P [uncultured archaeon]AKQ01703.1 30S ribosomal protein S8P [uncultured euryarchaeote Rifle_16ft_4_minimus_23719]AKQ02707.1 30S ribosomal protein S8P [uncultured euryarchaeote Rifle_16ft_4_minimus_37664]OGS62143.1 MAG: 30S ribosomal protein S8 [Euryarchaeota archaeon RBG_19FT_COMBO_69_17]